jgi:hypothetical protein
MSGFFDPDMKLNIPAAQAAALDSGECYLLRDFSTFRFVASAQADHIVRSPAHLARIEEYIRDNPKSLPIAKRPKRE